MIKPSPPLRWDKMGNNKLLMPWTEWKTANLYNDPASRDLVITNQDNPKEQVRYSRCLLEDNRPLRLAIEARFGHGYTPYYNPLVGFPKLPPFQDVEDRLPWGLWRRVVDLEFDDPERSGNGTWIVIGTDRRGRPLVHKFKDREMSTVWGRRAANDLLSRGLEPNRAFQKWVASQEEKTDPDKDIEIMEGKMRITMTTPEMEAAELAVLYCMGDEDIKKKVFGDKHGMDAAKRVEGKLAKAIKRDREELERRKSIPVPMTEPDDVF
jgi:hypothetical protein